MRTNVAETSDFLQRSRGKEILNLEEGQRVLEGFSHQVYNSLRKSYSNTELQRCAFSPFRAQTRERWSARSHSRGMAFPLAQVFDKSGASKRQ